MNRRAILVAGPALALVGAAPAATPIMRLFREWQEAEAAEQLAFAEGAPEAQCEALSAARQDLDALILAEPCRSATDWIAKAAAISAFGTFNMTLEHHGKLWAEACALVSA